MRVAGLQRLGPIIEAATAAAWKQSAEAGVLKAGELLLLQTDL